MSNLLYQITPDSIMLMNCYVIKTKNNKIIVIDGGGVASENCGYLYKELQKISGKEVPEIDAWFFSHMHDDPVNEFITIGKDKTKEIIVKNVYFNFASREFMEKVETGRFAFLYDGLQEAYDRFFGDGSFAKTNGKNIFAGDTVEVDGVKFEILLTVTDEEIERNINDTSLIFRATIDNQTVMFLGDAFIPEGNRLLEKYGESIKSDVVQMAHHGQSGVDKDVYATINPKLCLWPSPQWVFDNINGNLRTLEVREWMLDIGVEHHVVTGWQGTQVLSFPIDFDKIEKINIKP